jgi:DNA polymerase-3 subunit beta
MDFLRSTRRAAIFARDSANIVRLALNPGEELTPGRLTLSATAVEIGDNEEEMDALVEGEAMQVAFNGRYLTDVLSALNSTQVSLETTGERSPGVLRPVGGENLFTHVIMPMQTR